MTGSRRWAPRHWRRWIALAALLAAGGVVLALAPWRRGEGASLTFVTAPVDRGRIGAQVTATGTLSPRKLVAVSSQISGRVTEVLVDFNDEVARGQVLARLDRQMLEAQRRSARAKLVSATAGLARAKVMLRDAEESLARESDLRRREVTAAVDLQAARTRRDAAAADLAAAGAQIGQARAAVDELDTSVSFTTILSPVDGIVISRDVDVGQTVAAALQAPTLFTIAEDLGRMQIDTSVSEADVGHLRAGLAVRFTVDAFGGREFTGSLRQVRNAAVTVQNIVTYDAVIDVDNPERILRPGMTANVTFVVAEIADAVRIPNSALRFRPTRDELRALGGRSGEARAGAPSDRRTVWKLAGARPVPVEVRVGLSDGTHTQLVEGDLAAGDAVLTEMRGAPSVRRAPGAF